MVGIQQPQVPVRAATTVELIIGNMNKSLATILFFLLNTVSLFAQRGQVHESEWRDPEDGGDTSWTSYIITLLIIFGIPWLISEIIKAREKKK